MSLKLPSLFLPLSIALAAGAAVADEGMWLFNKPPSKELKEKYGFDVTPQWLEHLQKSCVRFSTGGSGSIVSPEGLVMTNHHVGSDILFKLSTPEKDLIVDGFYAKTRAEEIPCPDLELDCLWEIVDVTERIEAAAKASTNAAESGLAKRQAMSAIEDESTKASGLKSEVVTLYQGGRYHLYRYKRYTDLRLVFAPEKQAAFFGGDPDNFEYPRFDLDCCFFRIYDGEAPLKPEHYLTWSKTGCAENDLVFVAGHPGRTERLFTADHLKYLRDVRYPKALARLWRREVQLRTFSDRSEEWRRIAEDEYFGVQNSRKAFTGLLAGLLDPRLVAEREAADAKLKAFVASNPENAKKWGGAWDQIAKAQATAREVYVRNSALNGIGSELFGIARHLVRLADEKPKPSSERLREYNDSLLPTLEFQLFSPAPIHVDLEVERVESGLSLLVEWLGYDDPLVQGALAGKSPRVRAQELIGGSKLADVAARRALYDGGKAAVDASQDPLVSLAKLLDPEARGLRKRLEDEVDGPQREGYSKIAAAKFLAEGETSYPDATFTLRLSYGTVKGYEENGKQVAPFTKLSGLYQRSTERGGLPPFDLPKRWIERKSAVNPETPYDFVSTCDIIGGNSGSPVVDRSGAVVGLIFDGNIQSLPLDLAYSDVQARAVSVDSRAMIEAINKVYDAAPLAREILGPNP